MNTGIIETLPIEHGITGFMLAWIVKLELYILGSVHLCHLDKTYEGYEH